MGNSKAEATLWCQGLYGAAWIVGVQIKLAQFIDDLRGFVSEECQFGKVRKDVCIAKFAKMGDRFAFESAANRNAITLAFAFSLSEIAGTMIKMRARLSYGQPDCPSALQLGLQVSFPPSAASC